MEKKISYEEIITALEEYKNREDHSERLVRDITDVFKLAQLFQNDLQKDRAFNKEAGIKATLKNYIPKDSFDYTKIRRRRKQTIKSVEIEPLTVEEKLYIEYAYNCYFKTLGIDVPESEEELKRIRKEFDNEVSQAIAEGKISKWLKNTVEFPEEEKLPEDSSVSKTRYEILEERRLRNIDREKRKKAEDKFLKTVEGALDKWMKFGTSYDKLNIEKLHEAMKKMEKASILKSLSIKESVEKTFCPELLDYFTQTLRNGDESHVINCIWMIGTIRRALYNGTPSNNYGEDAKPFKRYFREYYELSFEKVHGLIEELEMLYEEYKITKEYIQKFQ